MIAAPPPLRAWVNPGLLPAGCIGVQPDLGAAEHWLHDQGCTTARGPLDGATWYAYRANLGPHDRPPFPTEPTADPRPWLDRGYHEIARYRSTLMDSQPLLDAARERSAHLLSRGWRVQTLADIGDFDAVLHVIYRLSLRAFERAFSYTPVDWATFQALHAPSRDRVDPRLVLIGLDPQQRPAAFCFCLPDLLNPGLRQFIIKTLAVAPEHAGLGVGTWMTAEAHRAALELGWNGGGIHALMWTGTPSVRIGGGGRLLREYALFEKPL